MDLISIIIPIYNVEKYIHRCVDSVINQTYSNLEIILVDDGSPDNCGKICDEYAEKDSRIKVIHKENGGLSDARNFGINSATGDWLFFLDSDDWIHLKTIEKLYEAAVENDVSVSMCSYSKTDGVNPMVNTSAKAEVWSYRDMYLQKHVISTVAWAKLYCKECFKIIRYPIGKIHEDEFVTYRILFEQQKIAFINQPYYAYYTNLEGITKNGWNSKRLAALEALEERLLLLRKYNDPEVLLYTEELYFARLVHYFHKAELNNDKRSYKYLKKKAFFLTIKSPRKLFSSQNIWVLEHFFPRFMRCYWLGKAALKKMFGKKSD